MAIVDGKPLFITKDSISSGLEKTAMYRLSHDPSQWEREILSFLHEQQPYLQDYDVRVHMNRTDPDSGAGVGQLVIEDKIAVPVIIDNFKLFPLDIFWHEDKLKPMTKPSIMSALQSISLGKSVEPGKGEISDMSIYNLTRAPFSGKYSFAEGLTYTLDDLRGMIESLGEEGFEFAMRTNEMFKEAFVDYTLGAQDEPLQKEAESETLEVSQVQIDPFQPVKEPGLYSVVRGGLDKRAAFVFDNVMDWEGNIEEGMKMAFCLEDGSYAIQSSFGVLPRKSDGIEKTAMDPARPRMGDVGFFWRVKEGAAVATRPGVVMYSGSGPDLLPFTKIAELGLGGPEKKVFQNEAYENALVTEDEVFLSPEWQWTKLGSAVSLSSPAEANRYEWPDGVASIHRQGAGLRVEGIEGFPKYAEAEKAVKGKLEKIMAPEILGTLLKKVKDGGNVYFVFTKRGVTKEAGAEKREALVKAAEGRLGPRDLVQAAVHVRPAKYEFFKLAVDLDEEKAKKTIDSVLSLNFVNDDNLYKFVENTPELEDTVDSLAKLLIGARLGLDIEDSPIRTALFAMDEVVRQLKHLGTQVYGEEA